MDKNTPRLLGAAFLIQAVASAIGALVLIDPLIVPGNIIESMTNIANHPLQMRAGIVFQMITAMGVTMLGVMLYLTLKKVNRNIAFVAMGFYILEAAIFASSRIPAISLIGISQESIAVGHPDYLQTMGNLLNEAAQFGDWLHMLVFSTGATIFYSLFYKSGYIPKALNLLGLVAATVALIGTSMVLLGYDLPLVVFLPNLPFELGVGIWLLIRGIKEG